MKVGDSMVEINNRKAKFDYEIIDTVEAGIVLTGTEVKSIRKGSAQLKDSYALVRSGEAYLLNMHISEYKEGNRYNHDPLRSRRLLLHKKEIARLAGIQAQQGMTIIPLKVYLKHGFAKVLIGVGQGKKQYDKRQTIKKRDQDREIHRKYGI